MLKTINSDKKDGDQKKRGINNGYHVRTRLSHAVPSTEQGEQYAPDKLLKQGFTSLEALKLVYINNLSSEKKYLGFKEVNQTH